MIDETGGVQTAVLIDGFGTEQPMQRLREAISMRFRRSRRNPSSLREGREIWLCDWGQRYDDQVVGRSPAS